MLELAVRRSVAQPPEWAPRQEALFAPFETAVGGFLADPTCGLTWDRVRN